MNKKIYIAILVLAILLLFPLSIPGNAVTQNDGHINFSTTPVTPQILGYSIKSQSSSLVMNGNGSIYIYTAVDGGGVSITGENFYVINSVIDGNGVISAVTGNSTSNFGQYNSNNIATYAIGGISIGSSTGINSTISFEGIYSYSNGAYAANHVNGTFMVNSSGSLVVIVAAGSTNDNPIVAGNFSFQQLDELNSSISIVQDYAVLNQGTYSISVNMTNDGQNLNGCSVIMEVYVIGKSVFYPPQKYPVTFTESGLPSGTLWSVSLGNQTISSSNNTIIFSEYNGTYSYSIPAISGLYPSPSSGNVTVAGKPLSLAINFLPPSTTITVGSGPTGVAYDSSNGYVYVTNYYSDDVSVIDGSTNKVIASSTVGAYPEGLAYDPSNGYIYVANFGTENVSVIDGATNTVITTIFIGYGPSGMASQPIGVTYDPFNGYVYVADSGTNDVSVINSTTNKIIASIGVGSSPYEIAYDTSNRYLYVTNAMSDTVSVINSGNNNVIETINVGSGPTDAAYDSSNGYVYVTNYFTNNVSVINGATNKVIASINIGTNPAGVAYDPSNGCIYVANEGSNTVSVINGESNNIISTINVGKSPIGVAYDPSNGYIYVANSGSDTVSVIPTSPQPIIKHYTVTFTESGLPSGTLWSVSLGNQTISSSNNTIIFSEYNGTYSYSIPAISGLYPSPSSGNVTVAGKPLSLAINFLPPSTTITVGSYPLGVAYDSSNGYVYVANSNSSTVSVINGATNKVIANIAVGSYPFGVAYDSSNGYVYVANEGSNNVSVINGASNKVIANIAVGSSPLGLGYDSSNGYVYVTNWGSNNVSVINGASNKVIASIAVGSWPWGVAYDSSNGYVYVTNEGSNNVSVINGASNKVIASIAVGSYPYGVAYDSSNGYVYVANDDSSSVSVINGATNTVIASIAVGLGPWGVAYDSSNGYVYVANEGSNNVSVINGATNTVIASIAVGSEPAGVAYDSSNGYVYVANYDSNSVSIISTPPQAIKKYSVTFTESGLTSGISWSVIFNGTTESSTGNTIKFNEPNGTYSFSISPISGYSASPSSGSITVNGANVNQAITFTAVTPSIYKITFTESGLSSGTTWSATLSGATKTANSNTIVFNEPNGTYSFIIGAINGYTATPSSGTITVNGSNVNQGITFTLNGTKVFVVTFTENGLPSGTMWYVNLSNGQSFSSTTDTITLNEPNGTYSYTISTKDKNYVPVSSSGTFTVNGANVNQTITFKAVATPTNYLLYMIIVIVVIIAVLGAVMAMRRGKNKGGPKQWQEPPKQQPPQQ